VTLLLILTVVLGVIVASACDGSSDAEVRDPFTIEPSTPSAPTGAPIGGKPAEALVAPTLTPPLAEAPPEEVFPTENAIADAPTPVPTSPALDGSTAPQTGRWIDVNVSTYAVRLMDGTNIVQEIAPVGVGQLIDTGDYASTQTGLFYVNSKIEELAYDPPYDTYISHWVGFDADRANGFHSFLKDASGSVVDASTGRISNGCIRTGEPEAVYGFAEIGMHVWVHW
jgi:hypothetical protein